MPSTNDNRLLAPAWGISLAVHGTAVWLAFTFAAQIKPAMEENIFTWDVALVETVQTGPPTAATAEPEAPGAQPPAPVAAQRPVEPIETVMHKVAPRESVQMVHPEVQPPPEPFQPREEPLSSRQSEPVKNEPAPVAKPPQEQIGERLEQEVVEVHKRKSEPVSAKEPEPVQAFESVMARQEPVAAPPSYEALETRPAEVPTKPSIPEPVASFSPEATPSVPSPPSPGPAEAPVQMAKAAPSGQEVKADYRWLAESLWRRVAELKRYPTSARLNGQEGKVILKAVIRSDGQLAEVSVQKSSGHHILDAAAIEAVKLACPLHMKHAISKPEIVVNLPIVYSLAN